VPRPRAPEKECCALSLNGQQAPHRASLLAMSRVWIGPGEVSFGPSAVAPRLGGAGATWPRLDAAGATAIPVRSPASRCFANAAGAKDPEERWEQGLEVLQSIKVRDEDLAEELARGDADLGATDEFGSTPLILAARAGMEQLCKVMIELPGVDVNAANHFGSTALVCAATNGHLEVCEMLLQRGADVNHRTRLGGTALGKAASSGQEAVCRRLVEAGAQLDPRTKLGDTAADLARKGGHEELAKLLASASSA